MRTNSIDGVPPPELRLLAKSMPAAEVGERGVCGDEGLLNDCCDGTDVLIDSVLLNEPAGAPAPARGVPSALMLVLELENDFWRAMIAPIFGGIFVFASLCVLRVCVCMCLCMCVYM